MLERRVPEPGDSTVSPRNEGSSKGKLTDPLRCSIIRVLDYSCIIIT
jgi:hypothetical protein